jgi:hypothetical protein
MEWKNISIRGFKYCLTATKAMTRLPYYSWDGSTEEGEMNKQDAIDLADAKDELRDTREQYRLDDAGSEDRQEEELDK